MTNEEIIIEIPLPCELNTADLNRVMNEARADEREKVIKEIEDYLVPCNVGIQAIGDHHYYRDLLTKLNSLREAK